MNDSKSNKKKLFLNVIFIFGIVVLILILAFALIRFVPQMYSGLGAVGKVFTSPFKSDNIEIFVSNSNVRSNEEFLMNWNYDVSTDGEYAITYHCDDGIKLYSYYNEVTQQILCNTNYSYPSDRDSATLRIEYSGSGEKQVPLTINYFDEDGSSIANNTISVRVFGGNDGDNNIIITENDSENNQGISNNSGDSVGSDEAKDVASTNNLSNIQESNLSNIIKLPDLAILNAISINNQTIQFTVRNIGGAVASPWYFAYTVPGDGVQLSQIQPILSPGQGIRYTINLANPSSGSVAIVVDSTNEMNEISETNNISDIKITGGSTIGVIGGGNYNFGTNPDLIITEIQVGQIIGSNFIADGEISDREDAAVRFVVTNQGGQPSGLWRFNIDNLPYDSNDEYESSKQNSLSPGQSIEVIVEFKNPDAGRYSIELEIDSDDDVREENERNNSAIQTLRVRD